MAESRGEVPSWVTDGWYSNNTDLQKLAIRRFHQPVTKPAEREASLAFVPTGETFPCSNCGKFAFPSSRLCFWCLRG